MHHQRHAKEVRHREQRLQLRRARQHQQNREQPGCQQRCQAQRQPGHGQRLARVLRYWQVELKVNGRRSLNHFVLILSG